MVTRDPLTRYWFIDQLARNGQLASVEDGWITRRLLPPRPGEYADRLAVQSTTDPTVHAARRRARKAKQG